jgi:hypothetical protein
VNRKVFDLIIVVGLLLKPATGLARMGARRWSRDSNGPMEVIGDAVQIGLGS